MILCLPMNLGLEDEEEEHNERIKTTNGAHHGRS